MVIDVKVKIATVVVNQRVFPEMRRNQMNQAVTITIPEVIVVNLSVDLVHDPTANPQRTKRTTNIKTRIET